MRINGKGHVQDGRLTGTSENEGKGVIWTFNRIVYATDKQRGSLKIF
ncbi:MAG: hypothetical protein ACI88A_000118 [Paraglaciecola sp.]|jgi:hypothetical protein